MFIGLFWRRSPVLLALDDANRYLSHVQNGQIFSLDDPNGDGPNMPKLKAMQSLFGSDRALNQTLLETSLSPPQGECRAWKVLRQNQARSWWYVSHRGKLTASQVRIFFGLGNICETDPFCTMLRHGYNVVLRQSASWCGMFAAGHHDSFSTSTTNWPQNAWTKRAPAGLGQCLCGHAARLAGLDLATDVPDGAAFFRASEWARPQRGFQSFSQCKHGISWFSR